MLTTEPQFYIDVANFLGSAMGATAAALVPYWAVLRQNQAQGLPAISFDKKFAGTMFMALAIGFAVAFMSFSVTPVNLTTNQSLISIFILAAVSSATANRWLNSYLAVSPVVTQVSQLKKENQELQNELSISKLKITSIQNPIKNEVTASNGELLPIKETVIEEGEGETKNHIVSPPI